MPTTITPVSNANAKVRFREQYVSDGLNKKFNGIVPSGIIRGGGLVTAALNLNVTLVADADTGDSIFSYINADGQQVTFRVAGNLNLNLAGVASTDVYIALYIDYSVGADTVVEWRAYTIAELTTAPVAEAPYLVVIGRVNVPASGPIAASDILPELRRDAWETRAAGMEPWIQIVENGSWELAETTTLSGNSVVHVIAWDTAELTTTNYTWRIVTTAPRSGARELEILGDGASTESEAMRGTSQTPVIAGDLLRARFYIRGNVWGGIGASGHQGVRFRFLDSDKQFVAFGYVDDVSLSGTFAYTLVDGIIEVPAGAAFVRYELHLNTDGATPSGSIFFDDIMVWKQSAQILEESTRQRMGLGPATVGTAYLVPQITAATSMDDSIEETLQVLSAGALGGDVVTLIAQIMGTAGKGFNVLAQKMGVQVQRQITDLGGDLLSTDADADLPRIETKHRDNDYTLIWESQEVSGGNKIRLYAYNIAGDAYFGLSSNARHVNATANWFRDTPGDDSWFYRFGSSLLYQWSDTAAGDPFASFASASFYVAGFGIQDGMEASIGNGKITFPDATAFGTNPTSSTTPIANTLYAKTVIKAYGKITIVNGGAASIVADESFNILTVVNNGLAGIKVTMRIPLTSLGHSVVLVTGEYDFGAGNYDTPIWQTSDGLTGADFFLSAVSVNNVTVPIDVSNIAFDNEIRFVVLGKQS